MVEKHPWLDRITYLLVALGVVAIVFPVYYTFVASTLSLDQVNQVPMPLTPGSSLFDNLGVAWTKGKFSTYMWNSLIMAVGITFGKITISMLSAFAITYFDFKMRQTAFWMVFLTLMLPVEVRILPTYEVAANVFSPLQGIWDLLNLNGFFTWISGHEVSVQMNFSLLDSYSGLILPLIASATATFLFRQFFLTVPDELCEAAKMDGTTPMQFFRHILFPLSKMNIAALTVIIFVFGWNQYLWPLLITTDPEMKTAVIGIQELIPKVDETPEWNVAMAGALLTMLPPILVVVFMQKWFVKGLIDSEK